MDFFVLFCQSYCSAGFDKTAASCTEALTIVIINWNIVPPYDDVIPDSFPFFFLGQYLDYFLEAFYMFACIHYVQARPRLEIAF